MKIQGYANNQQGMSRRGFIKAAGAAIAGAAGYGAYTGQLSVGSLQTDITGDNSGSMTREFGWFSGGFEELAWTLKGDLLITLADGHDMDGFGIRHTQVDADEYNEYAVLREAPLGGGRVGVDFDGELSREYPSREFILCSVEGDFSGFVNIIEHIRTSVKLRVPKNAIGDEYFPDGPEN